MADHPIVENAPGIRWKRGKRGQCIASWRARSDLIKAGFRPTSLQVFAGLELTEFDRVWISERCLDMQAEMLAWSRGGIPHFKGFDGSLHSLICAYTSDPDSGYHKLRYCTKQGYGSLMRTLTREHGADQIGDIKARTVLRWHEDWLNGTHVAKAHALITMVRTLMTFGKTILESQECAALKDILRDMKFPNVKPREERLTAEQANSIRRIAHAMGQHSIALAQALQFELTLRQKDVIGEWVPVSEPGVSELIIGNEKWLRGLRWSEIDKSLIIRHETSKRKKSIEVDLKLAPMIMEELGNLCSPLPAAGPIIISEKTGLPYINQDFRTKWRAIATEAGVPKEVWNMDSRAGAISEATDAGADLEHVRHAATHSNIATTQRYSRGNVGKVAQVMQLRAKHRSGNADSAPSAPPSLKSKT